ncbi:GNAT family N-acetyltransferase [Inquilinus sp. Marseille-Q2685]|uniref:GNAT family N-acetyltransferase n=1 Tax=Inquilinus sp. Marseille-Q2685 TaxID=2866581 RepID=UPI001CE44C75|nr:GNAT family N-acetyltransferase [Inquilinus sp. Marseille-Q2685]
MTIRIRPARPQDRDALGALKLRASLAWGDHVEALRALPEARQVPAEHLPAAVVAERDGAIAGFATVLPCGDGEAELEDLFVDPAAWGRGIGRRLLAEAETRAIALGARSLHVVAGGRARAFYERYGFRVTGPVMTDLEPAFAMQKDLTR